MTKTQAINKLLAWLNAQVGYTEGANNWNKYAEDPRVRQLLGWYAQSNPWCMTFVGAAFVECFGLADGAAMLCTAPGAGTALCKAQADMFKAAGRWSVEPQEGDVIFYIVDGDINHVGIVERVEEGYVTAIEGNSSDRVSRNRYRLNYPAIVGYGRPRWSVVADEADEDHTTAPTAGKTPRATCCVNIPMVQRGDECTAVESMQLLLIGRHFSCGGAGDDGDFGPATEQGLKNFQTQNGLEVDGVCGPATWTALIAGKG